MAETWHEYEAPRDGSVHSESLRQELREGATTTPVPEQVTCRGCIAWMSLDRQHQASIAN